MRRRSSAAGLAAVVAVVGGCSSSPDSPVEAAEVFLAHVAGGEAEEACGLMVDQDQPLTAGSDSWRDCVAYIGRISEWVESEGGMEGLEVETASIDGDSAVISRDDYVDGFEDVSTRLELERIDDTWYIADLG